MKLFPQAAMGLVFSSGTEYVVKLYEQMQKDIQDNKFKLLEVVHHLASGMKDVFTQGNIDGILQMR